MSVGYLDGMLILLTILGGKQRYEKATQMEAL